MGATTCCPSQFRALVLRHRDPVSFFEQFSWLVAESAAYRGACRVLLRRQPHESVELCAIVAGDCGRRSGGGDVTREETRALKDHIVRLYCERYTCRQIADLTGLTYRYVRDSLKERGIRPLTRVGRGSRTKTAVRADTSIQGRKKRFTSRRRASDQEKTTRR